MCIIPESLKATLISDDIVIMTSLKFYFIQEQVYTRSKEELSFKMNVDAH